MGLSTGEKEVSMLNCPCLQIAHHPDEEDKILEGLKVKAKIEDEKKDKEKEDLRGIPEFWLTVF